MTTATRPRRGRRAMPRSDRAGAALLLGPAVLGTAVFFAAPAVVLVWLSTQRWSLVGPSVHVGFGNVAAVLSDPTFGHAAAVTALIAAIALPVEVIVALLVAVAAVGSRARPRAWSAVIVLPWLVAPFVSGTLWRWILSPSGWISTLAGERFDGLVDPVTALISIALAVAWTETGYVALFFIAGLVTIPRSQTDAARVDGAGTMRILWSVQLPQLRPILVFVLVTGLIRMLGVYDQVVALTGGGPGAATQTLALWIYDTAFGAFDIGRAATASLLLLGIALVALAAIRTRRGSGDR